MEREQIKLTPEDLENFDFTGGSKWVIQGERYNHVKEIRTDKYSDGPSWDTVVQRESDKKYFKWHVWDAGDHNGYILSQDEEYQIKEVFLKEKIIQTYE